MMEAHLRSRAWFMRICSFSAAASAISSLVVGRFCSQASVFLAHVHIGFSLASLLSAMVFSLFSLRGSGSLEHPSAFPQNLPALCTSVKSNSCRRMAHLAIRPLVLFIIHWRLWWSVWTVKWVPMRYARKVSQAHRMARASNSRLHHFASAVDSVRLMYETAYSRFSMIC